VCVIISEWKREEEERKGVMVGCKKKEREIFKSELMAQSLWLVRCGEGGYKILNTTTTLNINFCSHVGMDE
jgi:hypothetical protein